MDMPVAAVGADTVKAYDVALAGTGVSNRTSYVIGSDGKIAFAFSAMNPQQHITKTLEAVTAMKK